MNSAYKIEFSKTIKLAIPIMVAQLGVVLMGITDTIMIGKMLGTTALSIAGISHSVAFLVGSVAVGGLHVVAPLVSKANAENNEIEISYLYKAMLKVVTGLGIVLTLITIAISWNFEMLDQPSSVNKSAPFFLVIIGISHAANYYFLGIKQVFDGLGKANIAMKITFAGLFLNVVLNYIFIKGFWFIPEFGIIGAAYSTLLSRIAMATIIWYILKTDRSHGTITSLVNENRDMQKLKNLTSYLYKITIPSGLTLFFEVGAFTFTYVMLGWIGEVQMAAHQVALNFVSAAYMVAAGISYAGGIRVGEGRGLKNLEAVKRAGTVSFVLIGFFMLFCSVIIVVFGRPIMELYIQDIRVIDVAVSLLYIGGTLSIFDGLQVGGLSVLRGLSDVNIPTIFTLFAYWMVALPLGYYFGLYHSLGAVGIYYGLYAGLACAAVLVIIRFYWLIGKNKNAVDWI